MIERYLKDLESRINPAVEDDLLSQWKSFLNDEKEDGFFIPSRRKAIPPQINWPEISVNEALDDPESMALQQLSECSEALSEGSGAVMNVRTNYGTGIMPSLFGAEIFRMDEKLNTLPTTKPLSGNVDAVKEIIDSGIPDLNNGYGNNCFETGEYFVETFNQYPNVSRYVRIYHPDLQGPMDICELLWGSSLFVDLIDNPDLVHSLLSLITRTYIAFMKEWEKVVPPKSEYSAHWGFLQKGRIMIRDDSAMNLSPEMFDEFIKPYDQKLLSELGGGSVHFCGRGDHYIKHLSEMKNLYGVNLSQPELNDMETIFRNTIDKKIMILGLQHDAAQNALKKGRNLRGRVHCWPQTHKQIEKHYVNPNEENMS
jgi:hypothetical protein